MAPDLVNLPARSHFNLYALNVMNGAIELVSAGADGSLGNHGSYAGEMTADGRYVVFQSSASNFGPTDTNGLSDIYLRDLQADTNALISQSVSGVGAGTDISEFPEISDDGKWVAFMSYATNLVQNDTNFLRDVFAWNSDDNTVRLVSKGVNGGAVNAETTDFSLSSNGRFVLFTASGTNLVVPNRTGGSDVYLHDLQNGTTRWVNAPVTNLSGFTSNSASSAVLSADARFVFLLASPAAPNRPAFVRIDLNDDTVLPVMTNLTAAPTAFSASVSDDGQFAAFGNGTNIWYWRASTGIATRADVTTAGIGGDGVSEAPVISRDGSKIAFMSTSSELVVGVGNGEPQVYVRDMTTGETKLVTHSPTGAATFDSAIASYEFSPDGSTLIFDSGSDELVAFDNNEEYDIFSWNFATGAISLVSNSRAASPSLTADGASSVSRNSISADGRFVAFRSLAPLTEKDTNTLYDAYVYDWQLNTNILVSAGLDGFSTTNSFGAFPMISADGRFVAFESNARGLAGPEDNRVGTSVYIRDLQTGVLVNASGTNTGSHTLQLITDNGRYVYFTSPTQLYRYDIVEKTHLLEATATSGHNLVRASSDGSRVVYREGLNMYVRDYPDPRFLVQPNTSATSASLPMLTTNGATLVYLKPSLIIVTNIATGETNSFPLGAPAIAAAMSADGNVIAYQRWTNATHEIWVLDRLSGESRLISVGTGTSTNGNGDSTAPTASADGRYIAFESWASNLVPGDDNALKDIFVYDRVTAQLSLVGGGNLISVNPFFGPGKSALVFTSFASDLVSGDLNDDADVFVAEFSAQPAGDSDGDGLDDAWEQSTFSTLIHGANDDTDADGATNREEFLAGTNANSVTSSLGISDIEVAADGSATVTFRSVPGKRYRLEFTSTLTPPLWNSIGNEISASATSETTVNVPSAGEGYYRLKLVE
jgi:Tol biopolymer transport system component